MSCNLFSLDIGVYIFVLEKPALIQIVQAVQILDQFNLGRAEGESLFPRINGRDEIGQPGFQDVARDAVLDNRGDSLVREGPGKRDIRNKSTTSS